MWQALSAIWGVLQGASGFLRGKDDYPKLEGPDGPLPLHYMQHARASADDLEKVWKDGHTICDDETGIPIARWSFSGQVLQPVMGFTIQGLPVYEDVPLEHPVWTTIRPGVPPHLGTPGSEGVTNAKWGPVTVGMKTVPYVRGEKLVDKLGMYGPLEQGQAAPDADPSAPGSPKSAAGLLALVSIGSFVAGVPALGIATGAAAIIAAQGPPRGQRVNPSAPRPESTRGQ